MRLEDVRVAVLPGGPPSRRAVVDFDRFASFTPAETISLREAFERRWGDDAHFLLYRASPGFPDGRDYRIKRGALRSFRERGQDVLVGLVQLEWDTGTGPEHVPWDPARFDAFVAQIEAIKSSGSAFAARLATAFASFSTRRGWRWTWRLARPLLCKDAEGIIRGLAAEAVAAGLSVDLHGSVLTWCQPFRLPHVTRQVKIKVDGQSPRPSPPPPPVLTWEDPFFVAEFAWDQVLDPSTVVPIAKEHAEWNRRASGQRPSDVGLRSLLFKQNRNGAEAMTPFFRAAKEMLIGRAYYPYIFERQAWDVPAGKRHDTLRGWVLSAIPLLLAGWPDATVDHIYAVFHPFAVAIVDRDVRDELWRLVSGAWDIIMEEKAEEVEAAAEEAIAAEKVALEGRALLISKVRTWWTTLPEDDETAWKGIHARLIVYFKKGYFLLNPETGRYDTEAVDRDSLAAQIKNLGLDHYIQIKMEKKDGGERQATVPEMTADRMVVASTVEVRPQIEGGYLEDPETVNPKLVLLSFRRNPKLKPVYSPDVAEWLFYFSGGTSATHHDMNLQTAAFLAIERGAVSAMSIIGVSGSGKKVYVTALEECFECFGKPGFSATERDLQDDFNGAIMQTCLLNSNEGFKQVGKGAYKPVDRIRQLTTGDPVAVNQKYMPVIVVRNPMRLTFTSNNDDMLMEVFGGDLSPSDREALAVRIKSYNPGNLARDFLAAKGGMRFTEGWIRGDAGQPSKFTVAQHFLWLYETYGKNMQPYAEHGLLFAGDRADSVFVRSVQAQGSKTAAVIEAITRMVDSPGIQVKKMKAEHGRLRVTVSGIRDFGRDQLRDDFRNISLRHVSRALKGLVKKGTNVEAEEVDGVRNQWYELDLDVIEEEARTFGLMSPKLEKLIAESRNGNGHNGNGNGNGHLSVPPARLPSA